MITYSIRQQLGRDAEAEEERYRKYLQSENTKPNQNEQEKTALDEAVGKKVEEHMKLWCRAHKNPQRGVPLPIMQFPVHEVLHAPLRLSVSFANHIKTLFPEFVNIVAQHTEIKSLATAWKKDKKFNLCGKKAAYFFRKLALLIKPLLTQEESIANLKLLSFFFILAKVRNIVGIMKTTKTPQNRGGNRSKSLLTQSQRLNIRQRST